MIDSIYVGITGVRSHQTRLNVISNNIANINTTAFKSGRASFAEVMSKTLDEGSPARGENAAAGVDAIGIGQDQLEVDVQGSLIAVDEMGIHQPDPSRLHRAPKEDLVPTQFQVFHL